MIILWYFYWPVVAAGLLIGFLSGKLFFRQTAIGQGEMLAGADSAKRRINETQRLKLAGGVAAAVAVALIWHSPLGAGSRLKERIESYARSTLTHFEMQQVQARLDDSPLRRRLVLSGPGDDVQQRLLAQTLRDTPGVSDVRWANRPAAPVMMK